MFNSIIINVPYISAFPVFPFTDASTLGISISGVYQSIPAAFDSFDEYPTGFQNFFSGSGFWGASGQTYPSYFYMADNFSLYETGINATGLFYSGQIYNSGYNFITGYTTGYVSLSGTY